MNKPGAHDGRELEMLLTGQKPLAAFSGYDGFSESDAAGGQDFANAVASSRVLRFENTFEFDGQPVYVVAFTRPEESWRGPAYLHLIRFLYDRAWCPHLEWLQGSLLGYSDAENSAHLLRKYGRERLNETC